eukprot:scaffold517_cov392-Prasinococcus_capsulatus_cf.AAC.7
MIGTRQPVTSGDPKEFSRTSLPLAQNGSLWGGGSPPSTRDSPPTSARPHPHRQEIPQPHVSQLNRSGSSASSLAEQEAGWRAGQSFSTMGAANALQQLFLSLSPIVLWGAQRLGLGDIAKQEARPNTEHTQRRSSFVRVVAVMGTVVVLMVLLLQSHGVERRNEAVIGKDARIEGLLEGQRKLEEQLQLLQQVAHGATTAHSSDAPALHKEPQNPESMPPRQYRRRPESMPHPNQRPGGGVPPRLRKSAPDRMDSQVGRPRNAAPNQPQMRRVRPGGHQEATRGPRRAKQEKGAQGVTNGEGKDSTEAAALDLLVNLLSSKGTENLTQGLVEVKARAQLAKQNRCVIVASQQKGMKNSVSAQMTLALRIAATVSRFQQQLGGKDAGYVIAGGGHVLPSLWDLQHGPRPLMQRLGDRGRDSRLPL